MRPRGCCPGPLRHRRGRWQRSSRGLSCFRQAGRAGEAAAARGCRGPGPARGGGHGPDRVRAQVRAPPAAAPGRARGRAAPGVPGCGRTGPSAAERCHQPPFPQETAGTREQPAAKTCFGFKPCPRKRSPGFPGTSAGSWELT